MKRMNLGNNKISCGMTFPDEIDIKIIRKPATLLKQISATAVLAFSHFRRFVALFAHFPRIFRVFLRLFTIFEPFLFERFHLP